MNKVYVLKKKREGFGMLSIIFLGILCFAAFAVLSLLIKGAYTQARENLIEQLHKEREIAETHNNLKSEYTAATRARYFELQAKRLGLKKAKEEEVLVLR